MPLQALHHRIYEWEWKMILSCGGIQLTVVYTYSPSWRNTSWHLLVCVGCILFDKITIMQCCHFIRDASKSSFQKSVSRYSKKIMCRFQIREVGSQVSVWMAQSSVRTPISVKKLRTIQGYICSDVTTTCPDALQILTRISFSFVDTYMGRQLHPFVHDP